MTNEAGLEFNRCKWRAENGTVSQENGASDALERLAKDIFDFTIVREPMAIQKDIDLLKFAMQSALSLENSVTEKQNSLSGVVERQKRAKAALSDVNRWAHYLMRGGVKQVDIMGLYPETETTIIEALNLMMDADAPQDKAETVEIPEGFRMSPEQNVVWDWAAAHGLTLVADECNDLLWRLEKIQKAETLDLASDNKFPLTGTQAFIDECDRTRKTK